MPARPAKLMTFAAIVSTLAVTAPSQASAGVFSDDLAKCLVQSASDADRLALVRWLFVAVSENPGLSDLKKVRPDQKEQADRTAAQMMQRLLITDCRAQTVAAIKNEGPTAIQASFGVFGQVAGRELMANPKSQAEAANMQKYLDQSAWKALVKEAGLPGPAASK